jgi:UDP-2-acetamido-2,6-beta-L-arabino-hexul-4-ose reductase
MIRIGITGQTGFIGTHLTNSIKLLQNEFELIDFNIDFFENESFLDLFVEKCDVIVHLAALNRHNDPEIIYKTNIGLVKKLVSSLEKVKSKKHVIFSSSSQEQIDNLYGKSKKDGRIILENWALSTENTLTGLIIPNVFGPFGNPYYNSVISTFSHQISRNIPTKIEIDRKLNLIYVGELVNEILNKAKNPINESFCPVPYTSSSSVSEILNLLKYYKNEYNDAGNIPKLKSTYELNLFNTFRSYIDLDNHFPFKLKEHKDNRGSFVEIIRLGIGGQFSFSTTNSGITRGNHFHTRKIERFSVIRGKALIQLRKIGTNKIYEFYLDGKTPSFVDMPIWYTHNIKNIGDEVLLTNFWINEAYDPNDSDTFFENV